MLRTKENMDTKTLLSLLYLCETDNAKQSYLPEFSKRRVESKSMLCVGPLQAASNVSWDVGALLQFRELVTENYI